MTLPQLEGVCTHSSVFLMRFLKYQVSFFRTLIQIYLVIVYCITSPDLLPCLLCKLIIIKHPNGKGNV